MQTSLKILSATGCRGQAEELMSGFPEIDPEHVELNNSRNKKKISAKDNTYQALLNNIVDIAIISSCDLAFPMPQGLTVFSLTNANLAIIGSITDFHFFETFKKADIREKFGRVTIIGFGPGDPGHLTIKGKKALGKADIIFYDDLIDKNYLSGLSCEKIFVGKRKGNHSKQQQEINRLLYQAASSGKRTVRLKGGDPSIFGRLAEEVQYLRERFIDVGIIPGVTSASAAAAVIGIPLTFRGISNSVAFLSGNNISDINIPNAGVLVFYMAASNLDLICKILIAKGWQPDTPVAIVTSVSMPGQIISIEDLGSINDLYRVRTPAIIMVGKTINRDMVFQYLNHKPKVLVTGTHPGNFEKYGQVIHSPLIRIKPGETDKNFINTLDEYDYLIFHSESSVKYFFKNLLLSGKDARYLQNFQIISTGETISVKLKKHGIIPDMEPKNNSSSEILDFFSDNKIINKKLLIQGAQPWPLVLSAELRKLGNQVDNYTLYKNEMPENIYKADLSLIHYITFDSPAAVDNFHIIYGHMPGHIRPVITGDGTRERMLDLNLI